MHPDELITSYVIFIIYASLVHTLPEPEGKNKFYLFLYRFLHALAANIDRMRKGGNSSDAR